MYDMTYKIGYSMTHRAFYIFSTFSIFKLISALCDITYRGFSIVLISLMPFYFFISHYVWQVGAIANQSPSYVVWKKK